jgi:hypothetical protein
VAFPTWVPADVARRAERLPLSEAEAILSPLLVLRTQRTKPKRPQTTQKIRYR